VAALAGDEAGSAPGRELKRLAAQPVLQPQPLGEAHADPLDRGAPIGEHRLLGKAGQQLGQRQRPLEVLPRRGHRGDQPDPLGLLGVDGAAGEDQVERPPEPDDPRQPLRPAVDQRHPPAALEEAEGGARRRQPQVTPERQLDPARQTPAVDRRDRRLRGGEPAEAHRPGRVLDVEIQRLQVGAGAEGLSPGPGEDEDAGAVVGLEPLEALAQGGRGRRVDGVPPLRPVDGQHRRRADPFVAHRPHAGIVPQRCGIGRASRRHRNAGNADDARLPR
jgi:hypothetical protein